MVEKFYPPTLTCNSFVLFNILLCSLPSICLSSCETFSVLQFRGGVFTQQSVCKWLRILWSPWASSLLASFLGPPAVGSPEVARDTALVSMGVDTQACASGSDSQTCHAFFCVMSITTTHCGFPPTVKFPQLKRSHGDYSETFTASKD